MTRSTSVNSHYRYYGFLILWTVISSAQSQSQQCQVHVNNSPETCSALLATTTEECECYIFCDGQVIQCAGFGEQVPFQCVGSTVAGCTRDMLEEPDDFFSDESTNPGVSDDKKEECAVTVNARDSYCGEYLSKIKEPTMKCDCYNFCNGKLNGCVEFGERTTFSCTGETVAGCLEEQRQYLGKDSAAVKPYATTILLSSVLVAAMMRA